MFKKIIPLFCVAALVVSCNKNTQPETAKSDSIQTQVKDTLSNPDPAHNAQNSLDVAGTYEGVVPCADCEGIKTQLVLNEEKHTYVLNTEYLGKQKDNTFKSEGSYKWSDDGSSITLDKEKTMYRVGEGKLIQLDMEGNIISGDLAAKYILTKK